MPGFCPTCTCARIISAAASAFFYTNINNEYRDPFGGEAKFSAGALAALGQISPRVWEDYFIGGQVLVVDIAYDTDTPADGEYLDRGGLITMQDNNAQCESRQYLRIALEKIGRHGLPADPVSYYVWYEYAAGRNQPLNTAIDGYLNTRARLSEEIIHGLFNRHIVGGERKITRFTQEQLKRILSEINVAITSTDYHYNQSNETMGTIRDTLVPGLSETAIEGIIGRITIEFDGLKSANASFRKQIKDAGQKILQLEKKLAEYRKEAQKDPLTRIANRRSFEKSLAEAIHAANSTEKPLCMIMADIDHFKTINDTHGHLVGDGVIKMVASTMKKSIKGRDLAARIGGEEFAIILPETAIEGAMKLSGNIRLSFQEMDLKRKNTGERLGNITLSFGVTRYRQGESAEEFIDRADEAMYRSKNTGRDRITMI